MKIKSVFQPEKLLAKKGTSSPSHLTMTENIIIWKKFLVVTDGTVAGFFPADISKDEQISYITAEEFSNARRKFAKSPNIEIVFPKKTLADRRKKTEEFLKKVKPIMEQMSNDNAVVTSGISFDFSLIGRLMKAFNTEEFDMQFRISAIKISPIYKKDAPAENCVGLVMPMRRTSQCVDYHYNRKLAEAVKIVGDKFNDVEYLERLKSLTEKENIETVKMFLTDDKFPQLIKIIKAFGGIRNWEEKACSSIQKLTREFDKLWDIRLPEIENWYMKITAIRDSSRKKLEAQLTEIKTKYGVK